MSVTISTPAQICNSPLNASPSKMLYSFAKGNRFGPDEKQPCSQFCYDLPPLKNFRTTSLGIGKKSDFTQSSNNMPAPNAYDVKDFVVANKKKGFSFGLSREAMSATGSQFVGDKTSPGPGAYDTREKNKVVISYTFKDRTQGPEGFITSKNAPGPGTYPAYVTLTPKGTYAVSKYKSSGACTFAPARSTRFPALKGGKAPGPGNYNLEPAISTNGIYHVSKFRDSGVRSFGHSMRGSNSMKSLHAAPGPGTYKLPSDFGHYESAHAKEFEARMAQTMKSATIKKESPAGSEPNTAV